MELIYLRLMSNLEINMKKCLSSCFIFFIIFLLNVAYANAAPNTRYEKKPPKKEKAQLMIKEKSVKKKINIVEEFLVTIGSKGVKGANKKGGFCIKFAKATHSYKEVKLLEHVIYHGDHDKCFKNIESYSNASDNISDVYFAFDKHFGTDDVRRLDMWDFLKGGVANFLDKSDNKFMGLKKENVKTGESMFIAAYPMILYDPNYADPLAEETLYKMFDNIEDDYLDEQKFLAKTTKIIMEYVSTLNLKDVVSNSMADQEVNDIYKNREYLYTCDKNKIVGDSFRQISPGNTIIDIDKIKKIDSMFKNLNINFLDYSPNELFNSSDFLPKLEEIFTECKGTELFSVNVQSRN